MEFNKQKHLLSQREQANAFRVLKNTKNLIDFSSNDYLGIAKKGVVFGDKRFEKGSGGSRLLAGNYNVIEEFEAFLAEYHYKESALMFNSGYNANVGFFSSVPQKGDTVLYDELIHASVKDGMRLSFAKNYSFKHNDLDDLNKKLERAEGDVYVVVESVYSMDGDSAPLKELSDLSGKKGFCLVVDEAHALGVFGNGGRGLLDELDVNNPNIVQIITFGKAAGAHGAAILSNKIIKDFLINYARAFIYTTALPEYSISSLQLSYELLNKGIAQKELRDKILFFKKEIKDNNLDERFVESDSAIQCILVPGNSEVKNLSNILFEKGIDVRPVMSPTVPKGMERLRICLHVFNTDNQIIDLINTLKENV